MEIDTEGDPRGDCPPSETRRPKACVTQCVSRGNHELPLRRLHDENRRRIHTAVGVHDGTQDHPVLNPSAAQTLWICGFRHMDQDRKNIRNWASWLEAIRR